MARRLKRPPTLPRYINAWELDHKTIVVLEEMPDGSRRRRRIRAEWSCFIKATDLTREIRRSLSRSRVVLGFQTEGDWVRVRWRDRSVRYNACKRGDEDVLRFQGWFQREGIESFEGDIGPVQRWLADNDVAIARPRRCYLDIETDSRLPFSKKHKMRVLCWCVVDEEGNSTTGLLKEDADADEKRVLRELFDHLADFDQVLAWNGDGFDFPVLRARAKHCKLKVENDRWMWLDHMAWFKKANTMAAQSGDEKQSFALHAIATALLGVGKDDFDASRTWEAWETASCMTNKCGNCRACMVRYCINDTDLLRRIEVETGYTDLLQTVCEACGLFASGRAVYPQARVDAFMLRLGRQEGHRFPTKHRMAKDDKQKFRGAFVMKPTQLGILHDVHVADFKGMYPSIIISWNLSPDTKIEKPEPTRGGRPDSAAPSYLSHYPLVHPVLPDNASEVPITKVWFDRTKEGLLPRAVRTLVEVREVWKKKKAAASQGSREWIDADRKSTALKIAVNSFYGVMGQQAGRFFDVEVAESVAQAGVWLIKETIKEAESQGFNILYADTDSLLVHGCTRGRFERFIRQCNEVLYPKMLNDARAMSNQIVLDFEKSFTRMVLVAKKRYAARYSHAGDTVATEESKSEIKGLEFMRGDTVRLCRIMQEQVIARLMSDDDGWDDPAVYVAMTETWLKKILTEPLDVNDVKLSKSLSKSLGSYARRKKKDGTMGKLLPHLEIAHQLKAKGADVSEGTKISYFCADATGKDKTYQHIDEWEGECDRYELWDSMVWPATRRVLAAAFPAEAWDRYDRTRPVRQAVVASSGQTKRKGSTGRRLAQQIVSGQGTLFE